MRSALRQVRPLPTFFNLVCTVSSVLSLNQLISTLFLELLARKTAHGNLVKKERLNKIERRKNTHILNRNYIDYLKVKKNFP